MFSGLKCSVKSFRRKQNFNLVDVADLVLGV